LRDELVGEALALVHLTTRPERFGLTLIEAMACGTPVLGAKMGSIPEIVVDGETGYLCTSVDDAVVKVQNLARIDRRRCRAHVEASFSLERMIDRYLVAYREALRLGTPPAPSTEKLAWRERDYWERPMGFTELPRRPRTMVS